MMMAVLHLIREFHSVSIFSELRYPDIGWPRHRRQSSMQSIVATLE